MRPVTGAVHGPATAPRTLQLSGSLSLLPALCPRVTALGELLTRMHGPPPPHIHTRTSHTQSHTHPTITVTVTHTPTHTPPTHTHPTRSHTRTVTYTHLPYTVTHTHIYTHLPQSHTRSHTHTYTYTHLPHKVTDTHTHTHPLTGSSAPNTRPSPAPLAVHTGVRNQSDKTIIRGIKQIFT